MLLHHILDILALYCHTLPSSRFIMLRNYASLLLLFAATAVASPVNDIEKRTMAKNFTEVSMGCNVFAL